MGKELGALEATASGVVASNGYAQEVMDAFERRPDSPYPRTADVFLRRLHASLRHDENISVGLTPCNRNVPRSRARKRMLEQAYLTALGWHPFFRGSRIAYWVAPGDDEPDPSRGFQHDEAVAAAKLPTDFDELESWGDPDRPIARDSRVNLRKIDVQADADRSKAQSDRPQTEPLPPEANATRHALIESDIGVAGRGKSRTERRLGITPTGDGKELDSILRPRRRASALSYAQRQAVERRAVAMVVPLLEAEGWTVRGVGATQSYDLHCSRFGNAQLFVEVKGTTQRPESIVLTANEVEVARRRYPDTALYVVHSITLTGDDPQPEASGGIVDELRPWNPDPVRLRPTAFTYQL